LLGNLLVSLQITPRLRRLGVQGLSPTPENVGHHSPRVPSARRIGHIWRQMLDEAIESLAGFETL
jgi:hypothetical protein